MADDRSLRGPQDRQRINLSEDYEVAYWSKKWCQPRATGWGRAEGRSHVSSRRQTAAQGTI